MIGNSDGGTGLSAKCKHHTRQNMIKLSQQYFRKMFKVSREMHGKSSPTHFNQDIVQVNPF
jgi:hypothetical protein